MHKEIKKIELDDLKFRIGYIKSIEVTPYLIVYNTGFPIISCGYFVSHNLFYYSSLKAGDRYSTAISNLFIDINITCNINIPQSIEKEFENVYIFCKLNNFK